MVEEFAKLAVTDLFKVSYWRNKREAVGDE